MSLVKCPECKREVSSFAVACPSCGFPVKEWLIASEKNQICPVCKHKRNMNYTHCLICGFPVEPTQYYGLYDTDDKSFALIIDWYDFANDEFKLHLQPYEDCDEDSIGNYVFLKFVTFNDKKYIVFADDYGNEQIFRCMDLEKNKMLIFNFPSEEEFDMVLEAYENLV